VPTSADGCWQVRCGAEIQEHASLRAFQQMEGIERLEALALAQPGIWIEVPRSAR
jgi:hypothetical protein